MKRHCAAALALSALPMECNPSKHPPKITRDRTGNRRPTPRLKSLGGRGCQGHLAGSVRARGVISRTPLYNSPTSLKLLCEKDFAEDG
jgi:hypothetical protein